MLLPNAHRASSQLLMMSSERILFPPPRLRHPAASAAETNRPCRLQLQQQVPRALLAKSAILDSSIMSIDEFSGLVTTDQ
mmetsp:Transcript_22099/g.37901  ORF Transcript_22099/g.37901 Transcript_22099/m.37901 type:complete len:80 (-) Transcript_22099:1075-1314(-)